MSAWKERMREERSNNAIHQLLNVCLEGKRERDEAIMLDTRY